MFYTPMLAVAGRFAAKHPKMSKSVAKHVASNVDHQAKAHIQDANKHAHAIVNHTTSALHNAGSKAHSLVNHATSELHNTGSKVNQHAHDLANHATSMRSKMKNGIHGLTAQLGSTLKSKRASLSKTNTQPPVITEAYTRDIAGMTGLFAGHIK